MLIISASFSIFKPRFFCRFQIFPERFEGIALSIGRNLFYRIIKGIVALVKLRMLLHCLVLCKGCARFSVGDHPSYFKGNAVMTCYYSRPFHRHG